MKIEAGKKRMTLQMALSICFVLDIRPNERLTASKYVMHKILSL